jgi:sulfur-carrier protein adenylyltransferase/sulfurtransferase
MIWYLENQARFRAERMAVDGLLSTSGWLIAGEWQFDSKMRVTWDFYIVVDGHTYPFTLTYPNHFPHSPPIVLSRDPNEWWTSHRYVSGEMCLEIGPDNWHPDLTGADMSRSAHKLIEIERPKSVGLAQGQTAVSRHSTTQGQDLRGEYLRALVTHDLQYALRHLPENEVMTAEVSVMFHEEEIVCFIQSINSTGGGEWNQIDIPTPIKYEAVQRKAVLVCWPTETNLPATKKASELRLAIKATDPSMADAKYIFIARGDDLTGYWLNDSNDTANRLASILPPPTAQRLNEEHKLVQSKKIAIIGCGSLGSKVATMLARSGVAEFFLVDDDIFLPHNLVRNELDWREVGTHKVNAVARRIQLVNPNAKSTVRRQRVGGQESSGTIETLVQGMGGCDLIIDATADGGARSYIDAAVVSMKKPIVWAEVFGGGFGGLIARHRPGQDPDAASIRRSIENYCREQNKPTEPAAGYESKTAGAPWIADDADVSVIASHAARFAIDVLLDRNPSSFPYSVYLIGMAKWWIFEAPFDTHPLDVGAPTESVSTMLNDEEKKEEATFLDGMANRFIDANKADDSSSSTPQS